MLKKTIRQLTEIQRQLLLKVWIMAHTSDTVSRQKFNYVVPESDKEQWDDLIDAGYIDPISGKEDWFILTSDTDDIYTELISLGVKDHGGGNGHFQMT